MQTEDESITEFFKFLCAKEKTTCAVCPGKPDIKVTVDVGIFHMCYFHYDETVKSIEHYSKVH